jgi:phosphoribosyl-ATP pyrophosphohydrolase/phosphoribosyl-AMP cyclohydrolase
LTNKNIFDEETNAVLLPEQLKYDAAGLIPAVIQDNRNGAVLMVGYMNRESLQRTLESGRVWFWSRSRRQFWLKGESSGNFFTVCSIYADCDSDALLVKVIPEGAGVACHTGRYSCFFKPLFKQENTGGECRDRG